MIAADAGRVDRCSAIFEAMRNVSDMCNVSDVLPQEVLRLLLEDPGILLQGLKLVSNTTWIQSSAPWQVGEAQFDHNFVNLRRRCSYGRQCDYRVHRFRLPADTAKKTNDELRYLFLMSHRRLIFASKAPDAGFTVSGR